MEEIFDLNGLPKDNTDEKENKEGVNKEIEKNENVDSDVNESSNVNGVSTNSTDEKKKMKLLYLIMRRKLLTEL